MAFYTDHFDLLIYFLNKISYTWPFESLVKWSAVQFWIAFWNLHKKNTPIKQK